MSELTLFNPSNVDLIWTITVSTLLLIGGGISIWLLPWSEAEIQDVHNSARKLASNPMAPVQTLNRRMSSSPNHTPVRSSL